VDEKIKCFWFCFGGWKLDASVGSGSWHIGLIIFEPCRFVCLPHGFLCGLGRFTHDVFRGIVT